jgi:hypothetical protein
MAGAEALEAKAKALVEGEGVGEGVVVGGRVVRGRVESGVVGAPVRGGVDGGAEGA